MDGRKQVGKQIKKAEKSFEPAMKKAAELNTKLDKPAETLLSPSETEDYRQEIKSQLQPLYLPKATKQEGVETLDNGTEAVDESLLESIENT